MYSKSNENTKHYYDYLKCNLNFINEINDRKKNLEKMKDEQQNKLQEKVKDLESKIELFQNQVNDSNNVNSEQLNKKKDLEKLITQLQNKLENQEKELYKKQSLIESQIVASVEKGFLINAEIKLKTESGTLDTSKSKVIVSISDVKFLLLKQLNWILCKKMNSDAIAKKI